MVNSSSEDSGYAPTALPPDRGGDTGVMDTLLKLADEQDALRFGSIPTPDYDFWARKSYWTVDQAVALSLAKDPTVLSWDAICSAFPDIIWTPCQITDLAKFSRFTNFFRLRRELLFDNIIFGKLGFVEGQLGWVAPVDFIIWIKQHALWAPPELAEQVQKYNLEFVDWEAEASRLRLEMEGLESELKKYKEAADEPHPRARTTYQKMILAMAKSKYDWGRDSSAVGKIVKSVEKLGEEITLSDDTIRTALQDAALALGVAVNPRD